MAKSESKKSHSRKHRSRSRSYSRSRSRSLSRSRRHKSRTRSRSRSFSRTRKLRTRSPSHSLSRSRSRSRSYRRRSRSRSHSFSPRNRRSLPNRHRRYQPSRPRYRSPPTRRLPGPERRDVMPFTSRNSPPPNAKLDMTAEERDERTVFVQQLARGTQPRDLEDFFSSVGNVRDVRIITDSRTGRSKGIAYVEFWERETVPLALGLSGQRLFGAPLIIQLTQANLNRESMKGVGGAMGFTPIPAYGPLKLCVSNLHPSITEEMLLAIFDPFGKIQQVEVPMIGPKTNKGYGYIVFQDADNARRALEQLNGFELADRTMRVTSVEEKKNELPEKTTLNEKISPPGVETHQRPSDIRTTEVPAIATQCFLLSNMFDPSAEIVPGWEVDVRDDVIDECAEHGGAVHIYVDKGSQQGNVYVKCPSVETAYKCVQSLHGRWFAGKVITANYVPVASYHTLFPDSRTATELLKSHPRE
uniref:RRM domain-containing protein n=1 Tax=Acrobeloides nanus TaxID=290746 RepID=A0A914BW18_9BILA